MIIIFFQTGDNCLVQLASRYTQELQRLVGSLAYTTPSTLINCAEVLQQLEDLRLAEWSDHAPPPPSAPLPGNIINLDNQFRMYYDVQRIATKPKLQFVLFYTIQEILQRPEEVI